MPTYRLVPKGDLALPAGTTAVVDGIDQALQRAEISLDIFLGEYFLNTKIGMPYRRDVLIHSPNAEVVRSVFRKALLLVPGIVDVPELEVVLDTSIRKGTVTFLAVYEDGTSRQGTAAFII